MRTIFELVLAQATLPSAPSGWENWDSRTVVVFIAVTTVSAMLALIWYLLREQASARESFLKALHTIQSQFQETEHNGTERYRLLRVSLKKIQQRDEEHAKTLHSVHQLLEALATRLNKNDPPKLS